MLPTNDRLARIEILLGIKTIEDFGIEISAEQVREYRDNNGVGMTEAKRCLSMDWFKRKEEMIKERETFKVSAQTEGIWKALFEGIKKNAEEKKSDILFNCPPLCDKCGHCHRANEQCPCPPVEEWLRRVT